MDDLRILKFQLIRRDGRKAIAAAVRRNSLKQISPSSSRPGLCGDCEGGGDVSGKDPREDQEKTGQRPRGYCIVGSEEKVFLSGKRILDISRNSLNGGRAPSLTHTQAVRKKCAVAKGRKTSDNWSAL